MTFSPNNAELLFWSNLQIGSYVTDYIYIYIFLTGMHQCHFIIFKQKSLWEETCSNCVSIPVVY